MLVPVALHTWVVMYPCEMKRETHDFIRMLQKTASNLNMQISEPRMVEMSDDGANTYIKHLDKVITTGDTPQIIVCVASNNREDRYRAIKKKCCVEHAGKKSQLFLSWC
jgi:aubergine-like protein